MDRDTLFTRLRATEWNDFEVKSALGGVPRDAYATVSALANTAGGWIVFGAQESKQGFEVTGVTDPDALQNDFLSSCRSPEKLSHPIDVRARLHLLEGKQVLAFYIPPSGRFERPIRVRMGGSWQSYVRVGGGDYKCTPREEARFHRDAGAETFDAVLVPGAGMDSLDSESLSWLRGWVLFERKEPQLSTLSDEDWLRRFGLLKDGALTRAAILLCGNLAALMAVNPTPRVDFRLLNYAFDEPVPAHRWSDRELCDGNIVQAVRVLLERFDRLSPNPFALEPDGVTRRPHGPHFEVLREALINLLVHQDHGDTRIARILWYRDRVLFDNPGDSLVAMDDLMQGGASTSRNPLIQRMVRLCGLAEQAGLGVIAMRERWRELTGEEIVVRNDAAMKTYEIEFPWPDPRATAIMHPPVATRTHQAAPQVTHQATPQVTPQVRALLQAVQGESPRSALMEAVGLKDRMHFALSYLQPALTAGLIEMTLPDKPRSPRQTYRLTDAGRATLASATVQP